ncbi:hypothetical protein Q4Q34_02010 [Flavivirga abyssicola]|nr:hypothetical protein [Flavivirga sp. MEBiC07777]WVK13815.1 hypothetical protein Q4Q34_02010 [Flavivirga sp. MEBiC07777]
MEQGAAGSIDVITINMNRLIQTGKGLKTEINKIQKYQIAYRKLIEEYKGAGLLLFFGRAKKSK